MNIFKDQITSFSISFYNGNSRPRDAIIYEPVLKQILIMFINLQCLQFNPVSYLVHYVDFLGHFKSSSLVELHITVFTLCSCIELLDGRFDQLRILYVRLFSISPSDLTIKNEVVYFINIVCI